MNFKISFSVISESEAKNGEVLDLECFIQQKQRSICIFNILYLSWLPE